jgi:hypothetical protein
VARIPTLSTGAIVSADGRPLPNFKTWVDHSFKDIRTQLGLIQTAQATADAALTAASGAGSDGVLTSDEKIGL